MLGYKTKTRPGLVALYDIRPGNGAGLFLQPPSRHGARPHLNATQCNITRLLPKSKVFFCGPCATFPPNFAKINGAVFAQSCQLTN